MVGRTAILAGGVVLLALGGGATVLAVAIHDQPGDAPGSTLVGNDFGRLRRDALGMYPRGSPLAAAADGLKALGFQCAPARHLMANINAPSVQCESAGRGYPTSSRLQVTVMARNGMVADIAIGNGFDPDVADARTPDPDAGKPEPVGAKGAGKTPEGH